MRANFVIAVFSYNRGRWLQNCLESIERCAPGCRIIVADDRSDEADTQSVLDAWSDRIECVTPSIDDKAHKLGGLYPNMQRVLDTLDDADTLCTLQEDMQLVRPLRERDFADIRHFFDSDPRAAFLHHGFMKGHQRQRYIDYMHFDAQKQVYFRDSETHRVGSFFAAVCIAQVGRLRAEDWHFEVGEKRNNTRAAALYSPLGYMQNPFAMWLPSVPAHRHKTRTLGMSLAEKRTRVGYYPINVMDESAAAQFVSRDRSVLPIAEDFLSTTPSCPIEPWVYHPFQGQKALYFLHRLQQRIQ